MIKTAYFLAIYAVFGLFLVIFASPHAFAAWPLNTPEHQSNPVWAGQNLLWNDDRLGSVDIFMRDERGFVSPLVTGAGTQKVLAASVTEALISDDQSGTNLLYEFDTKTHALHSLASIASAITTASVWQNQTAWADGQTAWWWDGVITRSHPFAGRSVSVGPYGVALMNSDSITVWQKSSELQVECDGCVSIASFNDQLAMLNASGTVSLWPSGQLVASADPSLMLSNGTALAFNQNGLSQLFRDGQIIPTNHVIKSEAVLGVIGSAYSDGTDIALDTEPVPTVTIQSCDLDPNAGQCHGTSYGWRILITAIGAKGYTLSSTILVKNGRWDGAVVPNNAADDTYTVSIQAESALGQRSTIFTLGQIIIDHIAPKITDATVEAGLDSARIHIQTDEKTSARISIVSDSDSDDHRLTRLTFSHTLTVQDLDPGQSYEMRATMRDQALNEAKTSMHFMTPALSDPIYTMSATLEPKLASVWEGELVVPPGIIDSKQAVLLITDTLGHQRPIRLEWTIGIPPPDLGRARIVRVKGTVNAAGTTILLHRSSAIAIIDDSAGDPDYVTVDKENPIAPLDTWVQMYGVLSSVRKTSWNITIGDQEYTIHGEQGFPDGFSRGDAVIVEGYTYDSSGSLRVALQNVELDADASIASVSASTTNVSSTPKVVLASAPPAVTPASNPNVPKQAAIALETTNTYDKGNILWYSIGLYGIALAISRVFFFGRGKKSR